MDRQQIFQDFVNNSHGQGRAMKSKVHEGMQCTYFGCHGCAIGGQPGFKEKFADRMKDSEDITYWLTEDYADDQLRLDLLEFFGIVGDSQDDIAWLQSLQDFHDAENIFDFSKGAWLQLHLNPRAVERFCTDNDLKIPTFPT